MWICERILQKGSFDHAPQKGLPPTGVKATALENTSDVKSFPLRGWLHGTETEMRGSALVLSVSFHIHEALHRIWNLFSLWGLGQERPCVRKKNYPLHYQQVWTHIAAWTWALYNTLKGIEIHFKLVCLFSNLLCGLWKENVFIFQWHLVYCGSW